jgi:hypothetical protein
MWWNVLDLCTLGPVRNERWLKSCLCNEWIIRDKISKWPILELVLFGDVLTYVRGKSYYLYIPKPARVTVIYRAGPEGKII